MTNVTDVADAANVIVNGYASDKKMTEHGSAKFYVKSNGDTIVENIGILTDREIRVIREFIKENYREMYLKWTEMSNSGFYNN